MTFITPFDSFNTVINVLMGTGPILLPPAVAAAGLSLGIMILLIMAIFSAITAQYIIECLSACNQLETIQKMNELPLPEIQENNNAITEVIGDQYEMNQTFELGNMGKIAWGRAGEIGNVINVILYLYGIIITKGIIVGNTISALFIGVPVLDSFYFWITFFYVICGFLSFRDVSNIAIVQTIIGVIRYLTIYTMIIAAIQTTLYDEAIGEPFPYIEEFNASQLANLFSTTVLAYLMHHSIPSMLRPVRPSSSISKILIIAFIMAFSIFVLISMTGMFAFPYLYKFCQYNTAFAVPITTVAYYIISFYIFLNISALPVLTITTRKNMMKLCVPHLVNDNAFEISWVSAGFTLLVLLPCYALAVSLRNNIHFVVSITGGVCGVMILLVIPSFMVVKFRTLIEVNNFPSYITNNIVAYIIGAIGIIFVIFNVAVTINYIFNPSSCFENYDQYLSWLSNEII